MLLHPKFKGLTLFRIVNHEVVDTVLVTVAHSKYPVEHAYKVELNGQRIMGLPLAKTKQMNKDYRPLKCQLAHSKPETSKALMIRPLKYQIAQSELDTHKAVMMKPLECQIALSVMETYEANMIKPCH